MTGAKVTNAITGSKMEGHRTILPANASKWHAPHAALRELSRSRRDSAAAQRDANQHQTESNGGGSLTH